MAEVLIERCVPSDRAGEIISLFHRVGHPEFTTVFDRVYRVREQRGLRSWIGLLPRQAVLHICMSPWLFSEGDRVIAGGILGDLMADPTQRDFWGPVALVRRMVGDVRASQYPDFLLTSYIHAAEAIFRAAGFTAFPHLIRYVLPLVWPYPALRGLQHGERRPRLTAVPFGEYLGDPAFQRLRSPGCFRPVADTEYFGTRMPRVEYPAGHWLIAGTSDAPDALVLTSPRSTRELVIADVLWRDEAPALAGLLSSVARWAARREYGSVSLTTLEGSRLAIAAQRAGFLLRPDPYPLMLLTTNPAAVIPPPAEWWLTPFALNTW